MKKFLVWFLLTIWILPILSFASFPQVSAKGVAVYDCSTDRLLYAQNADQRLSIASTTKIMTAVIAIEHLQEDQIITVNRQHLTEGSSMYLKLGEKIFVRDVLYGLMLMSGNDAALALAHSFPGGYNAFIAEMNQKAAKLGMSNSSFANPNGLESDGHYSSARDLAILTTYAMKNPVFRAIVGTKSALIAGRQMANHNKLLFQLEGATGVKTGFTSVAGRCLVSAVERNNREVVVVTLGCGDDWNVHKKIYEEAFSAYTNVQIVKKEEILAEVPLISGDRREISVHSMEDFSVALTEGENIEKILYLPQFVYAPISKGDQAGELAVYLEDQLLKRIPLYYGQDSSVSQKPLGFWEKLPLFFKKIVG